MNIRNVTNIKQSSNMEVSKLYTPQLPILLIHGYGIGISSPFQETKMKYGGFLGLKSEIQNNKVSFYPWFQREDILHNLHAFNPKTQLDIYFFERSYIESPDNQLKLLDIIESHKIEYIIAHSMGADFLLRAIMLQKPAKVKKIFLIQSDAARNFDFGTIPEYIEIHNYHHIMDYELWSSCFINRQERAGLRGFADMNVHNHTYIPAPSKLDIHHNAIGDPIFCKKILDQCV